MRGRTKRFVDVAHVVGAVESPAVPAIEEGGVGPQGIQTVEARQAVGPMFASVVRPVLPPVADAAPVHWASLGIGVAAKRLPASMRKSWGKADTPGPSVCFGLALPKYSNGCLHVVLRLSR